MWFSNGPEKPVMHIIPKKNGKLPKRIQTRCGIYIRRPQWIRASSTGQQFYRELEERGCPACVKIFFTPR